MDAADWRAGAGRRLLARIIDGLVLLIPILVVTVPIGGGLVIGSGNDTLRSFVATSLGVAVAYAYFVVMEAEQGATVGKAALGIEVRAFAELPSQRDDPSAAMAARRNLWMLLGIIPGGIGGLVLLAAAVVLGGSIWRSSSGRGVHDRWSGAILERER
jgi:uncharacterized RDD family membrane protein YckC